MGFFRVHLLLNFEQKGHEEIRAPFFKWKRETGIDSPLVNTFEPGHLTAIAITRR